MIHMRGMSKEISCRRLYPFCYSGASCSCSIISTIPRSIFPRSSIFHHPYPLAEKAQHQLDFFDRLSTIHVGSCSPLVLLFECF